MLVLKRDHHEGHFTNCQLQMGLCGAIFCGIAVFVFNGMIIMRIYFQRNVFIELIHKINSFYEKKFVSGWLKLGYLIEINFCYH